MSSQCWDRYLIHCWPGIHYLHMLCVDIKETQTVYFLPQAYNSRYKVHLRKLKKKNK